MIFCAIPHFKVQTSKNKERIHHIYFLEIVFTQPRPTGAIQIILIIKLRVPNGTKLSPFSIAKQVPEMS